MVIGVSLHILDAVSEPHKVPSELVGTFDIVHIRLLIAAISNNNPIPVLKTALALLKPGGFLQWTEIFTEAAPTGEHKEGKKCLMREMTTDSHLSRMGISKYEDAWMVKLPEIFEQVGLGGVEVFDLGGPKEEMRSAWATNQLEIVGEVLRENRDGLLEELASESRDGVYAFAVPRVVIGRKAG